MIFEKYTTTDCNICSLSSIIRNEGFGNGSGRQLKPGSILRIIRNRVYTGETRIGDTVNPNGVPALIDEATFESAQEKLAHASKHKKRTRPDGGTDYMLTGKITVASCGQVLSGASCFSHTKKFHRYYSCSKKDCPNRKGCPFRCIPVELMDALTIASTIKLLSSDKSVKEIGNVLESAQADIHPRAEAYQKELSSIEEKIANIMSAIEEGIDNDVMRKRCVELSNREKELKELIQKENLLSPKKTDETLKSSLSMMKRMLASSGCKKNEPSIVETLIQRVEITEKGTLKIFWRIQNDKGVINYSDMGSNYDSMVENCGQGGLPTRKILIIKIPSSSC
jgi:site-specific DNA recombinase